MSIVLATAAGLLVYVIAYKFIYRYQTRDLKEVTGSLFRVVGTLEPDALAGVYRSDRRPDGD